MAQAPTNLDNAMLTLDLFLEGQDWAAGNKMTVADFSYAATIATAVVSGYISVGAASQSKLVKPRGYVSECQF